MALQQSPRAIDTQTERTRDRLVERTIKVFDANCTRLSDWSQAQSLIQVQRRGTRAGEPFDATSYYLSSLSVEAIELALGIRRHRDIENGLHWVKDVVLKEDAAPFAHATAATNWSIIRTIVLNLVRHWGDRSLSKAQRFLSHDLDQLFHLLTIN